MEITKKILLISMTIMMAFVTVVIQMDRVPLLVEGIDVHQRVHQPVRLIGSQIQQQTQMEMDVKMVKKVHP